MSNGMTYVNDTARFGFSNPSNVLRAGQGLVGLNASMSLDRRVEVESGCNQVNMLRDMLRKVVPLVACKVLFATLLVLVDVVLGAKELFSLLDGDVGEDPATAVAQLDPVSADTSILDEPRVDSVHRLLGGTERVCDLGGGPVLAVVGRVGVRDIEEIGLEVLQVRLDKAHAEGQNGTGFSAANGCPPYGERATRLVHDALDGRVRGESERGDAEGEEPGQQHAEAGRRGREGQMGAQR